MPCVATEAKTKGREVLKLNIDTGGVQARKIIDRVIAAERATVSA